MVAYLSRMECWLNEPYMPIKCTLSQNENKYSYNAKLVFELPDVDENFLPIINISKEGIEKMLMSYCPKSHIYQNLQLISDIGNTYLYTMRRTQDMQSKTLA